MSNKQVTFSDRPTHTIARSAVMQLLTKAIETIANSDLDVLVVGESGTEKEWVAHTIHQLSQRSNKNFVLVDCTVLQPQKIEQEIFGYEAISKDGVDIKKGAFEETYGGTIFFNDLAAISPSIQIKIARVAEHKRIRRIGGCKDLPINARFIAALNGKPDVMVEKGNLRKEILCRISPIILNLPPLRERRADIPYLIEEFLIQSNRQRGNSKRISPEALKACFTYDWPGNVSQLKNAIEYAIQSCEGNFIEITNLPPEVFRRQPAGYETVSSNGKMNVASMEKELIERVLNESRTKKEAAVLLGISLKTLYNKLNQHNLYKKFVRDYRSGNGILEKRSNQESGISSKKLFQLNKKDFILFKNID